MNYREKGQLEERRREGPKAGGYAMKKEFPADTEAARGLAVEEDDPQAGDLLDRIERSTGTSADKEDAPEEKSRTKPAERASANSCRSVFACSLNDCTNSDMPAAPYRFSSSAMISSSKRWFLPFGARAFSTMDIRIRRRWEGDTGLVII